MSTAIFAKSRAWAAEWAASDHRRVRVDSHEIASAMNPRFADDVRPLAAACAANALTNAARTGRDAVVIEDVPVIERRLRYIAKRENMIIKEI